jgi:hypothetical protein
VPPYWGASTEGFVVTGTVEVGGAVVPDDVLEVVVVLEPQDARTRMEVITIHVINIFFVFTWPS